MKPIFNKVLDEALTIGVGYGVSRAFKHSDNPDHQYIKNCVLEAVWNELYEWFEFEPSENSDLNV